MRLRVRAVMARGMMVVEEEGRGVGSFMFVGFWFFWVGVCVVGLIESGSSGVIC